jgi:hypothetical protein
MLNRLTALPLLILFGLGVTLNRPAAAQGTALAATAPGTDVDQAAETAAGPDSAEETRDGRAPRRRSVVTSIAASNFGMQCGIGKPTAGQKNCYGSGSIPIVWPATQAQPGLIRLHDSNTYWSILNPSKGTYDWKNLDDWLDVIAQHQPVAASQVFTMVPCWATTTGTCGILATGPTGSNGTPSDLTADGSPAFNSFVTAFVQHCSPGNHCVKDLITYYEMWNEWDIQVHWVGTMQQLYQMLAPAAAIIRANVPKAVILSPSATPASNTGAGYQCDFLNWLNYESQHGRISDWVDFHVYLTDLQSEQTKTVTPEVQWSTVNQNFLKVRAGGVVSGCSSGSTAKGWASTPWANTESNFNGSSQIFYSCPSDQYTPEDCTGQIVRWQILHDSNGASGLFWYYWFNTIGSNPQYEPVYRQMMQYMVGGRFTAPAASSGDIWTAPFVESSGTPALWVWTPNESGASFTVPTGYVDYLDLSGITHSVTAGRLIAIGTEPFLLEQQGAL